MVKMQAARPAIDIGILVSDIGRSLEFYCGFLGLEKVGEVDVPFGRMHRLRFGESFVKLIDPSSDLPAGKRGIATALGLRYLTFPVMNVVQLNAAAEQTGAARELEMQELLPGLMVLMLSDPDGNIVELVQRV